MPADKTTTSDDRQQTREHVQSILEAEVARVDSPEAAESVIRRLERLAAGATEEAAARQAAESPAPAPQAIERAAATGGTAPPKEAAAVLAQAAAEVVAPTPEAPAVLEAAQAALGPPAISPAAPPPVRRGRTLLTEAMLRRLGPLQKVDARLYLAINGFPHPSWSDRAANTITIWATGGWIWAGGVLVARLLGVPHSGRALRLLLPSMAGATWIVEHPVKAYVRRRRPFIDIVRALVVGKRPGSWSFPSGHTAASFAAATALSAVWPRRAPVFYTLAGTVGLSRIYAGAHYPGDVVSGALAGTLLSEAIRRATMRWWPALRP